MTRGIDIIAPGSRVRVIGDVLAVDTADSEFIGREGTVSNDDSAGADVIVALDSPDPRQLAFAPIELQVIASATDCPHGYRPTDSCPICD